MENTVSVSLTLRFCVGTSHMGLCRVNAIMIGVYHPRTCTDGHSVLATAGTPYCFHLIFTRFISTPLKPRSILPSLLHPPTQTRSDQPMRYTFCDLHGERTRPVRKETRETKNTRTIFLLCITSLVCSQIAWPFVWYSIFGQKYSSITTCLHIHSSPH